jgi:hypothetical protein
MIYGHILDEWRKKTTMKWLEAFRKWRPLKEAPHVLFPNFTGQQFASEIQEVCYRTGRFDSWSALQLKTPLSVPVGFGGGVVADLICSLRMIECPTTSKSLDAALRACNDEMLPKSWYDVRAANLALLLGLKRIGNSEFHLHLRASIVAVLKKFREVFMPVLYEMTGRGMRVSFAHSDIYSISGRRLIVDLDTTKPWAFWKIEFETNSAFVSINLAFEQGV